MNTMTVTKIAGALIGSLLVLLLVNWGASSLYHVGTTAHAGEEGEHPAQAYSIEVAGTAGEGEAEEPAEAVDIAALVASADPAAGEKVFGKCRACHKVDGTDGTGPHLNGVVGRAVAGVGGFAYSEAMVAHASEVPTWEPDALAAFLANPKGEVPGTKMVFAGLKTPEEQANLIAYLQSVGG